MNLLQQKERKLIKGHESLELTEEEREQLIQKAEKQFGVFLTSLGYDWKNDPHMRDTPHRYTKACVNELFIGNFKGIPKATSFEEEELPMIYDNGVVIQANIKIVSKCAHHLEPITGVAHIAYKTGDNGTVIGLSKLNRLADYVARRPQVQERLTKQIHNIISDHIPGNKGVAVYVSCRHGCCSNRGIGHDSTMHTIKLSGDFEIHPSLKQEFLFAIGNTNGK